MIICNVESQQKKWKMGEGHWPLYKVYKGQWGGCYLRERVSNSTTFFHDVTKLSCCFQATTWSIIFILLRFCNDCSLNEQSGSSCMHGKGRRDFGKSKFFFFDFKICYHLFPGAKKEAFHCNVIITCGLIKSRRHFHHHV